MSKLTPRMEFWDSQGIYPPIRFIRDTADGTSVFNPKTDVLKFKQGSRQSDVINDGLMRTTFIVFGNTAPNTAGKLRKAVSAIRNLFKAAVAYQNGTIKTNPIYFLDTTSLERQRRSWIVSGDIAPIDGKIVSSTLIGGHGEYIITIEHTIPYEHFAYSQLNVGGAQMFGGTVALDNSLISGTASGRIASFVVSPNSGNFGKMWIGFKEAHTSLSGFDPAIVLDGSAGIESESPDCFISNNYEGHWFDDKLYEITFTDNENWASRLRAEFRAWNSDTAVAPNRSKYYGKYRLILRYATDNSEAEWGIRASTGWASGAGQNMLQPQYVNTTRFRLNTIDLGEITIGDGVTQLLDNAVVLSSFAIRIHAKLVDKDPGDNNRLLLDRMWIVPADQGVYFELARNIGPGQSVGLYRGEDMKLSGYVLETPSFTKLITDSGATKGSVGVDDDVPIINELGSWSLPHRPDSKMIILGDRTNGTTIRSKKLSIKMLAYSAVEDYWYEG